MGCPNIQVGIQAYGGVQTYGGIKHTGVSKHMAASKHAGAIQTYRGIQMYGGIWTPLWSDKTCCLCVLYVQEVSKHMGGTTFLYYPELYSPSCFFLI